MKKLLLLLPIFFSTLIAEEKDAFEKSYQYAAFEALFPTFTYGYKLKINSLNVWDNSISISSILIINAFSLDTKFAYYENKNDYYAVGLHSSFCMTSKDDKLAYISPTFTKGWENASTFKELTFYFPSLTTEGLFIIPSFSFKYGWKF